MVFVVIAPIVPDVDDKRLKFAQYRPLIWEA